MRGSMLSRRAMLMLETDDRLNTSPKIAEYGYYLSRSGTGVTAGSAWCYTEYYQLERNGSQQICDNNTDTNHTFQYQNNNEGTTWDFWYGPKRYVNAYNIIRFSIKTNNINDSYAYSSTSGQIFFAGKNTIYYGYTNIHDMPTE